MSLETKIAWADSTASPWFGCTEVSPGCANCYAREMTLKRGWAGWGNDAPRVKSKGFWQQVIAWNRRAKADGGRFKLFPSLCDPFDAQVPYPLFNQFMMTVDVCQAIDFLLLTKRPELVMPRWGRICQRWGRTDTALPPNVWLGVSCEDQQRADERIPLLLELPATIRFISFEPLLGPISLRCIDGFCACPQVDWAIIGVESGPKRRDCGVEAICDLARQCVAADVPVFVKQDCAFKPGQQGRIPDDIWSLKQFPKSL